MKFAKPSKIAFAILFALAISTTSQAQELLRIGSKKFTESYVLAEILAQKIERELKIPVERKFGLGGTYVCFEALRTGAIDIYPEYSGTALEVLLKTDEDLNFEQMNERLRQEFQLEWLKPFGFNNSYALAMRATHAQQLEIKTNSDLVKHPELKFAFSHEFLNRKDGWPALRAFYRFAPSTPPTGMEHTLTYEALKEEKVDLVDAYTTDAKIITHNLAVLEDDRKFFPHYFGAPLVRSKILKKFPQLAEIVNGLAGTLSDETMRRLNTEAEVEKKGFDQVASEFLKKELKLETRDLRPKTIWRQTAQRTLQHLKLTFLSVLCASLLGIPLGILIRCRKRLAAPVLYVTGIVQTIPSIALLALMIPLFGIGEWPALVALFVYGLLPIVRNTYIGLKEIPWNILEAADGIGLRPFKKLRYVELPLAFPTILAGVKTSAVINVGTATLAAFIGAGGLGEPIVTGLALNDTKLILQGAIPAALLSILVEYSLSLFEKRFSWKTRG